MAVDLASLKSEILSNLESRNLPVFYTDSGSDGLNAIYWDAKRKPLFTEFLDIAQAAGARLLVFFERVFSQASIDDILERLEGLELGREEKRNYELRLKQLQKFEGFSCEIELSFEYGRRMYVYQMRTEWFEEFEDIFADVAVSEADLYEQDEEDDGPIPGYFSRN
jgi:hypothetical protein